MRKRHNEKLKMTLPALSPAQATDLVDWLLETAHQLALFYAAEIRSQQQATRNMENGNDDAEEEDGEIPF
jgi:hypothetical protein